MYPHFPQIITFEQLATIPFPVIVVALFLTIVVVALVTWAIIRWSQAQDRLDTFSMRGKEKKETHL
jgi:antibiotic biosynthesis monooxygenase (ABM) superfamily enzyme